MIPLFTQNIRNLRIEIIGKTKICHSKFIRNSKMDLSMNSNKKNLLKTFTNSIILLTPLVSNALSENKPDFSIVDDSGVLTKSSISFLEKNVQKIFDISGTRLYVISLRSLPYGEDILEYTKNLFSKWQLKENEVLVVLVNKIAKGSIFAGSEVKGLTESIIKSIGEETFSYKAKDEQYSSAAIDVSNRLVSILTNKGDIGPPSLNRSNESSNFKSAKVTEERRSKYVAIIIILLVIAFVVPMVQFFYYVKDE
mmetsp:Transcript_73526/g.107912  ORF Transcript_73526/g.107912 Transcript_73526/m.107912 type:complete len:253 (-) Transcript_73526:284-1042(-)